VSFGSAALRWLANKTPDLDEARNALQGIVREGHRADQVIGNIRALFKEESENRTPVDVDEVIGGVLALTAWAMRTHGVQVQTALPGTESPPVLGNQVQLQQVMLNLIMNAIEAMSSVTDRARVLQVRSNVDETCHLVITIEDSGPGIDPKNIDNIFTAFFTTKPSGMGMGLSICRSIIEAHGGQLTARPCNPHGSVFQISLPIYRAADR